MSKGCKISEKLQSTPYNQLDELKTGLLKGGIFYEKRVMFHNASYNLWFKLILEQFWIRCQMLNGFFEIRL